MIISRKREVIEKVVSSYNKDLILRDVTDIIAEVKANKWPDATVLFSISMAPITVGMVKLIPNWDTNVVVLQHMTSALIGRFMRAAFIQQGVRVDYEDQRDVQFITSLAISTDAAQDAAVSSIVGVDNHTHFKEHEREVSVALIEHMVQAEDAQRQTKH